VISEPDDAGPLCSLFVHDPVVLERSGARWPVSRVLSPAAKRRDDHSSGTSVTGRLVRPTRAAARKCALPADAGTPPLLGLAPGGVYHAAPVTGRAVRSYRTLSPFPSYARLRRASPSKLPAQEGGLLSVALSLGSPLPDVIRHHISVEPGLSSPLHPGFRRTSPLARQGKKERSSGHLAPGQLRRQCAQGQWQIKLARE